MYIIQHKISKTIYYLHSTSVGYVITGNKEAAERFDSEEEALNEIEENDKLNVEHWAATPLTIKPVTP